MRWIRGCGGRSRAWPCTRLLHKSEDPPLPRSNQEQAPGRTVIPAEAGIAGWPRAVTRPRLPQIRTCPIRASGSSGYGLADFIDGPEPLVARHQTVGLQSNGHRQNRRVVGQQSESFLEVECRSQKIILRTALETETKIEQVSHLRLVQTQTADDLRLPGQACCRIAVQAPVLHGGLRKHQPVGKLLPDGLGQYARNLTLGATPQKALSLAGYSLVRRTPTRSCR